VTYPYRLYGLTLGCDTPVSALPLEPSDFERYDVIVSLGPEADWVQEARRLPSHVEHPRLGEIERNTSPFTLTSYGAREFFELSYGNEARFLVDGVAERLWGSCLPPFTNEDLATYFVRSEQIPSAVSLGVFVSADQTVPRPPKRLVPPMTAAAMAFSRMSPVPEE